MAAAARCTQGWTGAVRQSGVARGWRRQASAHTRCLVLRHHSGVALPPEHASRLGRVSTAGNQRITPTPSFVIGHRVSACSWKASSEYTHMHAHPPAQQEARFVAILSLHHIPHLPQPINEAQLERLAAGPRTACMGHRGGDRSLLVPFDQHHCVPTTGPPFRPATTVGQHMHQRVGRHALP